MLWTRSRENYNIQKISVELAERRVESTTLLQQAGDASTRDTLEARRALLSSQNALTRALVDHYNASLDLFLAMESLKIQPGGFWHNGLDEATQVKDLAEQIEKDFNLNKTEQNRSAINIETNPEKEQSDKS